MILTFLMKINGDFQVFENAAQTITDLGACCYKFFINFLVHTNFFRPFPEQSE